MAKGKKRKYEDPVIEDLALDITDYASVMREERESKKEDPEHKP